MKKVLVLGATGSIGQSTLSIIDLANQMASQKVFSVCGVTSNTNSVVYDIAKKYCCPAVLVSKDSLEGLKELIKTCGADIAVNGIAGAAGLLPSVYVLEAGIDLALANKETVVMAWNIVKNIAKKNSSKIIPVDSEHSAVFSLINKCGKKNIKNIIITASGGPFRDFSFEQLKDITPAQALKHPTWKMGSKITIDSSTLANKGLEVIEASRLFDAPAQNIKVVIHPQSTVHAFVQTLDGTLYAQMSAPDMKRPIYAALIYPETKECPLPLDTLGGVLDTQNPLKKFSLDFYPPDTKRFLMLDLAYKALQKGFCGTIAYNAANEVAVDAFCKGKIKFFDIAKVVKNTMQKALECCVHSKVFTKDFAFDTIQEVLSFDKATRDIAFRQINHYK